MNLISTFKSIKEYLRNEICCDTTLVSCDGTKINFVIFICCFLIVAQKNCINLSLISTISTSLVMYLKIIEKIVMLVTEILVRTIYIQETSASEEPRLVFARKSKPAELVTEAEAHGAGHREASSISKAISDKRVNGEDETLDKIPRLSSVVVGVEDNTGDKEYPCLTCGN